MLKRTHDRQNCYQPIEWPFRCLIGRKNLIKLNNIDRINIDLNSRAEVSIQTQFYARIKSKTFVRPLHINFINQRLFAAIKILVHCACTRLNDIDEFQYQIFHYRNAIVGCIRLLFALGFTSLVVLSHQSSARYRSVSAFDINMCITYSVHGLIARLVFPSPANAIIAWHHFAHTNPRRHNVIRRLANGFNFNSFSLTYHAHTLWSPSNTLDCVSPSKCETWVDVKHFVDVFMQIGSSARHTLNVNDFISNPARETLNPCDRIFSTLLFGLGVNGERAHTAIRYDRVKQLTE